MSANRSVFLRLAGAMSFVAALTLVMPTVGYAQPVADVDADGIADATDNCVRIWNPDQANNGGDPALGDACDSFTTGVTTTRPADLGTKHQTVSGITMTLGAVAYGSVNQYMWDFGDGSAPTAWTAIANAYNLGINHVYTGMADQEFVATVRVRHSANPAVTYEASYPVIVKADSLDVRSAMAIEKGLWHLHTTMTRGTYALGAPGNGAQYGYWGGVTWYSIAAARAFTAQKHTVTGANRLTDPYNETIIRAANYLMNQIGSHNLTNQVHAGVTHNPDSNGNGYGLRYIADDTYYHGFFLDLILHLGPADWTTATGAVTRVVNRSLKDIAQDFVDFIAWGQADSGTYRGGWHYTANSNTADSSTSMYPATGLLAAREMTSFDLTVPAFVIAENMYWTNYVQNLTTGYFGYQSRTDCPAFGAGWYNCVVGTSSGILQMTLQDTPDSDPKMQKALAFLGNNWGYVLSASAAGSTGMASYPMYAAMKALRYRQVINITWNGQTFDWYNSEVGSLGAERGLRKRLVSRQTASGMWSDTAGNAAFAGTAATGLAVIMLSKDDYIVESKATANDTSVTYNGAAHAGTGTCAFSDPGSAGDYQLNGTPIAGAPVDAGTYTFVWSCPGDASHTPSSDTGTITIAKAPTTTTVVFEPGPYVYRGSAFTAGATTTGGTVSEAGIVTYAGDCTNVSAGLCEATATFAGDDNHLPSSGSASITILKAETTVSLDCSAGAPFTYTGAAITPCVATAAGAGVLSAPVSPVTYTNNVNAGTATASAFYPGDENHHASAEATATFAIAKAVATVTAGGETVTYDGQPHAGTCAVAGVGSDVLAGTTSYAPGPGAPVNAGTYTMTCDFAGDGNYGAASATATIDIARASATVTAGSGAKVYGTADPALTASSTGFLAVDGITVTQDARDAGENVGIYATHASAAGPGIANYTVQTVDGTLEITKAAATVTAGSGSKTYGQADPTLTPTSSGFLAADNITVAQAAREAGENAGSYATHATADGAAIGNYEVTLVPGTLTIGQAAATAVATGETVTYDGQPHSGSCTVNGVNGEVLTGTASLTPGTPVGAGTYELTCAFGGNGNYTPSTSSATIQINQAPLTVTADNASRTFGVANPAFSVTYSGFVNGETPAVLGGALSITTTATISSPLGTYLIVPSGLTAANYAIAFVNGTLTISNTAPSCAAAAPSVSSIWPANHLMHAVTLTGVTDAEGDALTINVLSIFQDEAVGSAGPVDGPEGAGVGTSTAFVRGSRLGNGNGRVYHITFEATDPAGASCSMTVQVGVPHDQSGQTPAVDDGALFNSTIAAPKK